MERTRHDGRGGGGGEAAPGPRRNDIIIVVMGMTGSGKSSFISQFRTGRPVGIGLTLESYTTRIEMYQCRDPVLGTFWLIDTPGFNDTYLTDAQVLETIAIWLNAAYRERIQLTGILYLHSIQENRVAGSAGRSLTWFRQLCGSRALRKVLLVTSFWDCVPIQLSVAEAEDRDAQLKQTEYWEDMTRLGARTARHYNTLASARDIIRTVISSRTNDDRGTYVELQEEMVDGHRRLDQTTVGQGITQYLEQQRRYFDQELAALRTQLNEALREADVQHRSDMEAQRTEFEGKRARLREDQDRLRANITTLDQRFRQMEDEANARREQDYQRLRDRERQLQLQQELQVLGSRQNELEERRRARAAVEARRQLRDELQRNYWCMTQ